MQRFDSSAAAAVGGGGAAAAVLSYRLSVPGIYARATGEDMRTYGRSSTPSRNGRADFNSGASSGSTLEPVRPFPARLSLFLLLTVIGQKLLHRVNTKSSFSLSLSLFFHNSPWMSSRNECCQRPSSCWSIQSRPPKQRVRPAAQHRIIGVLDKSRPLTAYMSVDISN